MLHFWDRSSVCCDKQRTLKLKFNVFIAIIVGLITMSFFPISSQAAICFLPDCGDKTGTPNTNVDAERCRKEGYESFQNRVCHVYSIVEFCPYNSDYIKCNNKQWCILNDYTKTECEKPYELFNKCPNGEAMYKECKMDMEEACKAEDPTYTDTCPAGWVIDPNDHCTYSEDFGHCCNTCPGFISKEELGDKTAVATCDSCDGKKYIAASDGFNMCEGYWDCQDGCAPDAKTCVSFGVTKCDKCKRCEAKCKNETCPENAACEYEACTWRYCDPTGCLPGYGFLCKTPNYNCNALGYDTTADLCKNAMAIYPCPFDNSKVYCVPDNGACCEKCWDFPYASSAELPNGYILGDKCTCCGKTYYKKKANPCSGYKSYEECPYGPAPQTPTCQSGDKIKFKECRVCDHIYSYKFCPAGYTCAHDTCSDTYEPTGCATGYSSYCTTPQSTDCIKLGYINSPSECAYGYPPILCPFNPSHAYCGKVEHTPECCDKCSLYKYTESSIPAGYVSAETCECCGKIFHKIKENPCNGFFDSSTCEHGVSEQSKTCLSGNKTLYNKCTGCENEYAYSECPANMNCEYDQCSNTYNPIGCKTGYKYYCSEPLQDCHKLGYISTAAFCYGKRMVLYCPYNLNQAYCK